MKRLLSDHVRTALRYLDDYEDISWKHKLFMISHGNTWTVALATILLCASLASTLLSSPSPYDIFYSFAWFFTLLACALIELVWIIRRKKLAMKYREYLKILVSFEKHANEEQLQSMHISWNRIENVRKFIWYNYTVVSLMACLTPISDSRLPTCLKGQSFANHWIIILQLLQCVLAPPLAVCSCHVIEIVVTNVLGFEAVFLMLCKALRAVKTEEELLQVIKPHSALLESCREIQKDFETWTFLLYSLLFSTSIFGTMSLISGVIHFELALFLLSQVMFFINLSVLGDKLQHSTAQFNEAAYDTPWHLASPKYRKNLLLLMLSSQRPAAFRCSVFGNIGYPTALKQFNTWYKFLQFFRKT